MQTGDIKQAGRLAILLAVITLAAGHSIAGQSSSSLGVGATVVRSCRANTSDMPASTHRAGDMLRDSRWVRCGKANPPAISVSSMPVAEQASAPTADGLTVTLFY